MTGWQKYWAVMGLLALIVGVASQNFASVVLIAIVAVGLAVVGWIFGGSPSPRTDTSGPLSRPSSASADRFASAGNWLDGEQKKALFAEASPYDVPVELRSGPRGLYLTDPSSGLQMPADNVHAPKADIWGVNVRGASHYANNAAGIRVGDEVRLEPEPENEHDPNAVAIQWQGRTIGYYNRGMAKRLTNRGVDDLRAVVIGRSPLRVLAAPPEVWAQIGEP